MFDYKSESGFTLLEIVLGTAVLGVLAVAVMTYWQTSTTALEDIHARHVATELAKNSIAKLRSKVIDLEVDADFKAVVNNLAKQESKVINNSGITFKRQLTTSNYQGKGSQQKIKASVTWSENKVVLDTIVTDMSDKEYVLEFDGIDDYLKIPDENKLYINDKLTISFWFRKTDQFPDLSAIPITKGDYNEGWWFEYDSNGEMSFWISPISGDDVEVTADISSEEWHYITGVFAGTKQQIYLDGELKEEVIIEKTISNTDRPLIIAKNQSNSGWGSDYTSAQIRDLAIWNQALTQEEIENSKNKVLKTGLIGYWKLNEGQGLVAYDQIGGNNGVVYGAEYKQAVINK